MSTRTDPLFPYPTLFLSRGGGVSRKITHAGDRKRLKQIVEGLDVPEGMAVIVRTAGSERTKTEIKRDYEYLLRLWDDIRETTLRSRSEERRVGTECGSTGRSRWAPCH